jgi:outer membrane protein assembly factor BamA
MKHVIFPLFLSLAVLGLRGLASGAESKENSTKSAPPQGPTSATKVGAPTGQAEIIKSIEFEGNRKYKDHVLRERLGFELGEHLDPFLAEGGRQTIAEVYRKIGFAFVEVSLDRERLAEGHLLYGIHEGPRVQIASVRFVGNEQFGAGTLKQVVKTTNRKWLLWPFYYTEDAIDNDVERLREFYYGRGFLDYKITAEKEFTSDQKRVRVIFVIEEGPVYRVADIVVSGNTRVTSEQLRLKIELKPGEVYLKAKADRSAKTIVQMYREQGYVDAEVRQTPKFIAKTEEPVVTVEYGISEGKQFRIGRIEVTGNEQTKDKVVRRVLDEYRFTPGRLYNAKMAPKEGEGLLEKYVQRSAMAQQVMIRPVDVPADQAKPRPSAPAAEQAAPRPASPPAGKAAARPAPPAVEEDETGPTVPPAEAPGVKDVRVDIEEGMTGMIRPGVGFSSDSGVIGQLIYRQQNFDISDWPKDLDEWFHPWRAFRGAGQTLTVALEPGTRYSQYYVDFVDPYWGDMPVTFDASGRLWERFRESYDEQRIKGAFEFERRLENNWRPSIGFRAENVDITHIDFDAPEEIKEVAGHNQLYGVRFGLGEIDLDDRYDPSRGHTLNTYYEQVTGDFTFGLLEATYVRYFTLYEDVLGRKIILATKVLGGTVAGDAPPFEKYYAGGTGHYGLRGFEYRGVSTRGLQTVPNPEREDPIGSDWIFLAGTEVTMPLVGENFRGLFFLDSGTVETGRYRLSIGTGIEIKVPQIFGNLPMRFEIGFPLLRDEQDETQVFSFSGGGLF